MCLWQINYRNSDKLLKENGENESGLRRPNIWPLSWQLAENDGDLKIKQV